MNERNIYRLLDGEVHIKPEALSERYIHPTETGRLFKAGPNGLNQFQVDSIDNHVAKCDGPCLGTIPLKTY